MGQRLIISEEERSRISGMYGLVNEQDEPGYRINKELVITSAFDWDKGESRTIYVKTLPGVFRENGKIREGVIFAYFSYDKNDTKGYGENRLDFGKRVQFTCGKNYVNLPPIPGLNNQGSEKFAGTLSDEDNQWVQQYCKREENTRPTGPTGPKENEISSKIKVFTSLNNVGRNNNPSYIVDGMNIIEDGAVKDSPIPNLKTVEVNAKNNNNADVKITLMLYCDGTQKKFYIGNRSQDTFNLFLSDTDNRDINNLMTKYFCKKK